MTARGSESDSGVQAIVEILALNDDDDSSGGSTNDNDHGTVQDDDGQDRLDDGMTTTEFSGLAQVVIAMLVLMTLGGSVSVTAKTTAHCGRLILCMANFARETSPVVSLFDLLPNSK